MKRFVTAACAVAMLSACNVNYDKTKSGVVYKIFSKNSSAPKIKAGEYVKFNIEFRIPEKKDTILNSTYGKLPGYSPVDTSARSQYSLMEILTKCSVGDSAMFILSVDTLVKKGMVQYDNTFGRGNRIIGKMRILNVFKDEQAINADYQKEMEIQKSRDEVIFQNEKKELEKYIADKGIKAQKTPNGAFVEIINPGDTALRAIPGREASIMYKGYLKSDNTVFDTNMDPSKGHTDAYNVVIGSGGVIPGWEEALPYLGKGGKGKLYIPSSLAYGGQGRPGIPAFATLIFDIEVKDVRAAKPQQGNPMMNIPQQQQQATPQK